MLTDDQKQALCEQYGCCNWALLDAAARLGADHVFATMRAAFPGLTQAMLDSAQAADHVVGSAISPLLYR